METIRTYDIPDDLKTVGTLQYGQGQDGEQLIVQTGRNYSLYEQLHDGAQEPQMLEMVPNDAAVRFSAPDAFEAWYSKGRCLVSFQSPARSLAVVVWHGPSLMEKEVVKLRGKATEHAAAIPELALPGAELDFDAPAGTLDTFAIRLYNGYRGMPKPAGVSLSLARCAMVIGEAVYVERLQAAGEEVDGRKVWLETNLYDKRGDRNGAVYLYEKAGYEPVGTYVNPDPTNVEWRIMMAKELDTEVLQKLGGLTLERGV